MRHCFGAAVTDVYRCSQPLHRIDQRLAHGPATEQDRLELVLHTCTVLLQGAVQLHRYHGREPEATRCPQVFQHATTRIDHVQIQTEDGGTHQHQFACHEIARQAMQRTITSAQSEGGRGEARAGEQISARDGELFRWTGRATGRGMQPCCVTKVRQGLHHNAGPRPILRAAIGQCPEPFDGFGTRELFTIKDEPVEVVAQLAHRAKRPRSHATSGRYRSTPRSASRGEVMLLL